MSLGAKLKELREEKGTTKNQVAAAIGVSRYMIIRLERDQFQRATSEVVAKLADYFGVSVDELLGELPNDLAPDVESMLRRAERWTRGIASCLTVSSGSWSKCGLRAVTSASVTD